MSDQKSICPLLEGFVLGAPMSSHDGIRCCPAMKENSDEKYIVKIISIPASQIQLDALLLTGAYRNPADATEYFRQSAEDILQEAQFLNTAAKLEGFLPYEGWQIQPMEDGKLGYEVYLLSTYRRSLLKHMRRNPVTHLEAVNLGLDLCAALAICRRAGQLYVDLKPANVFMTRDRQFRIGDLGFVKLDSLMYTSLPEKYHSPYAPPEVRDPMKTLNETVDTYAVGMILYQIYNEGTLPASPANPADSFPCPANADYEISAIIMKAIDPDPGKRWENPMAMGQALVRYMQRNTVNNVPIIPPSGILAVAPAAPAEPVQEAGAETAAATEAPAETAVSPVEEAVIPEATEASPKVSQPEAEAPAEPEETAEEPETEEEITDAELSPAEEESDEWDFSIAFEEPQTKLPEEPESRFPEPKPVPIKKQRISTKTRRRISAIRTAIFLLVLFAALAVGGFLVYQNYYLQSIDQLIIDGTQNELTVTVKTSLEESKLQVTCTDTYGNAMLSGVKDGTATFTDLLPDSLYRIEVTTTGFHQLTGSTTDIFTTDALINIVSMSAVTGPEDGSLVLSFTVDGSEPEQWTVVCSAEGEADITETFTGHTVTIKGLTIGKTYTLQLGTADQALLLGETSLEYTAAELILAENLRIESCKDGIMSVRWDAPDHAAVERWNVRCYNDDGHEEVLEIAGTEIDFTGIDSSKAYTVEVTAAGMTQSSRVSLTANPITITGYTVDTSDPIRLTVNWTFTGDMPEGGWLLMYSLDGLTQQQSVVKSDGTSAEVEPRIPGAVYNFSLQAADSTSVFGHSHSFQCPNAEVFNSYDLSAEKVTSYLLKTPQEEGWTAETIGNDLFTDTFQSGDSISVVLKANDAFELPKDVTPVLYVIRDAEGNVLSKYVSEENVIWEDLWYPDDYHNCELTIPKVPTEPGDYSISIYFNYRAMTSTTFTITE